MNKFCHSTKAYNEPMIKHLGKKFGSSGALAGRALAEMLAETHTTFFVIFGCDDEEFYQEFARRIYVKSTKKAKEILDEIVKWEFVDPELYNFGVLHRKDILEEHISFYRDILRSPQQFEKKVIKSFVNCCNDFLRSKMLSGYSSTKFDEFACAFAPHLLGICDAFSCTITITNTITNTYTCTYTYTKTKKENNNFINVSSENVDNSETAHSFSNPNGFDDLKNSFLQKFSFENHHELKADTSHPP